MSVPKTQEPRIEVVTNPSVRYDAEGLAGIINIILKKDRTDGFNGMVSVTSGSPPKHDATITFNYKLKKINLFGTAGINYKQNPGSVSYHRETTANDTTTTLDQSGTCSRGGLSTSYRLGLDYFLSAKRRKLNVDFSYSAGAEDGVMNMQEQYSFVNYVTDSGSPLIQRTFDLKKQSDSRRIERPSSRNLNPFNSYADPLNFWIGNPNLNPELTHSFEVGYIKYRDKGTLSSNLYYRHTDSVITRIRTLDSSGVSTTRPYNLDKINKYKPKRMQRNGEYDTEDMGM